MMGGWIATLRRRFSQDVLFWLCAGTVILLIPILLLVAWQATTAEQAQQDAAQAAMVRSAERRAAIQDFALLVRDAESSHRGYLLSGDRRFLRPYEAAAPQVEQRLSRLETVFADEPEQLERLEQARTLTLQRFAVMAETREARESGGLRAAGEMVASRRGENLMQRLRAVTDTITAAEAQRLEERLRATEVETRQARRVASTSYVLVLAAIALAAIMAFRYTGLRTRLITSARAEAERRQAIFDAAMDAILTFNPSGGVETMNHAAQDMFGYAPEELTGRDISVLVPDAAGGDALFLERLRRERGLREGASCELEARRKDGSTFPVDINFGEMLLPDGVHAVAVMRDCTERRRAELAKSEFISTVSHELRTPLTSIAGSLGLLAGGAAGSLPERADRLITIAESNSRRLVRLINDILDLDKIDSARLAMALRPLDVGDLVRRAIEALGGVSSETGVMFRYEAPPEPLTVDADADRLTQVLTNLLSNAAKFSDRGGTVRVRVWADGGRARLSIQDEGPGIPPEFHDRIFSRFAQADSSDTRQKGGTGLGLAISKEIVERHGGRIWFDSPPGHGATFHVELPVRSTAAAVGTGPGARLLLCEDDADVAHVLSDALQAQGFRTDVVTSLKATEDALSTRGPFDALLLDLRLPDGSGLDLLRRLRADAATRGLPAIIISADVADRAAIGNLDLVDWIEKPVDMVRLNAALDQATQGTGERPVVLHVDDDADLRQLVAEAFGARCRLISVENLTAARAALAREKPALAILDVGLPDGSGLDLLPDLQDDRGRPIPVVVFSAQAFDEAAVAQAVDAVLVKSRSSLGQLIATVRRLTASSSRENPAVPAGAEA